MEQLQPEDFIQVSSLLEQSGLVTIDLQPGDLKQFLGLRQAKSIVAVGGALAFGQNGLLRSIAISRTLRGSGLGKEIVSQLELRVAASGIHTLFLLTETAAAFFMKLDYEVVSRSQVPDEICATAQFSEVCPESATCMKKQLPPTVKLEQTE